MRWFRERTPETKEDEVRTKTLPEKPECSDDKEGREKLDSNERDRGKEFRDRLKVTPSSDEKEKLDTRKTAVETDGKDSGGERGNFERSLDGGRTDYER